MSDFFIPAQSWALNWCDPFLGTFTWDTLPIAESVIFNGMLWQVEVACPDVAEIQFVREWLQSDSLLVPGVMEPFHRSCMLGYLSLGKFYLRLFDVVPKYTPQHISPHHSFLQNFSHKIICAYIVFLHSVFLIRSHAHWTFLQRLFSASSVICSQ